MRWRELVDGVGGIDVDNAAKSELEYVGCVATLLDVASRHNWGNVRRASAEGWRQRLRARGQEEAGAIHKWTKPKIPWQPRRLRETAAWRTTSWRARGRPPTTR